MKDEKKSPIIPLSEQATATDEEWMTMWYWYWATRVKANCICGKCQ